MSYLGLGGRAGGFFIRGGSRLIGFSTAASNTTIRAFASSNCFNRSYRNNDTTSAQQGALLPLSKLLSTPTHPSITNANGVLEKQHRQMSSATGDHVTLWTAEKILSGALVAVVPLAFLFPCAPMDYLLAFSITIHSHWGIEAIVLDYVRPSVFGPVLPKIAIGLVYALSALTLGGLAYFTYTDVGLVNAIKMLWKL